MLSSINTCNVQMLSPLKVPGGRIIIFITLLLLLLYLIAGLSWYLIPFDCFLLMQQRKLFKTRHYLGVGMLWERALLVWIKKGLRNYVFFLWEKWSPGKIWFGSDGFFLVFVIRVFLAFILLLHIFSMIDVHSFKYRLCIYYNSHKVFWLFAI